ncbi:MAG: TonB-dependent receptor [Melioribacteraceae bacterium]
MSIKSALLILFVVAGNIAAQNNFLKGKITDSKNGNAIHGAAVSIAYNYLVYTNNEGYYTINEIPEGSYSVKVSRLGYKPLSVTLNVNSVSSIKDFFLEPSPIELDEVIVSTGRTDNYLRNSPYSEILVAKEQFESKPLQSMSDILKSEPGISLLRDGIWGTEISIRGLNRENVVTLIDGNRIATSTDIAARLSMVNLDDIERIEIIKGASSSIYGSGATGGIVNVITKSASFNNEFSLNGNLSSGLSSVNNLSSMSGLLSASNTFWSSKLSGSYRKARNTQTPNGELKNSQFEDYSFNGALNLVPLNNHLLKIDYQLFKATDVGIPGASVFPDNAEVRYPDEKRQLIFAGYEVQNISKVLYKFSAKYSYQFIERNVENIPHTVQNIAASGTSPAKRISVLKITPSAEHANNNFQIHGNLLLAENNNLLVGVDYWDRTYTGHREKYQLIEVLNSQGNVANTINKVVGEKPLPDSKYKSFGVFAQDDAELLKDKLTATVGARIDKITVNGESVLNPIYEIVNGAINYSPAGQKVIWNKINSNDVSYSGNVGLKYSATSNLDFTLSLGLSFRSPSLEERFQYIDQGSYVRVGDPNLNPEKGSSADLGIRFYSSQLKIVSSIFFNYFNDLVTEIPGYFEGRTAYIKTNIGKSRLYGFDLHADYNFYEDNVFYATLSYVKGDDLTSNGNLPEIPPLNGNLGIRFSLFNKMKAEFSSSIFAAQNKVAAGEISTPGYAFFNVYLDFGSFNYSSMYFRFLTGIENVFDKEYRNHLSTTRGKISTEPGRNIFLKLLVKF